MLSILMLSFPTPKQLSEMANLSETIEFWQEIRKDRRFNRCMYLCDTQIFKDEWAKNPDPIREQAKQFLIDRKNTAYITGEYYLFVKVSDEGAEGEVPIRDHFVSYMIFKLTNQQKRKE